MRAAVVVLDIFKNQQKDRPSMAEKCLTHKNESAAVRAFWAPVVLGLHSQRFDGKIESRL